MRNSFTYKCAQLCNKLPEDVKLADNVNIFKSKLRSIDLFTDTEAILNSLDLRSIMGYPGGMSTISYTRIRQSKNC